VFFYEDSRTLTARKQRDLRYCSWWRGRTRRKRGRRRSGKQERSRRALRLRPPNRTELRAEKKVDRDIRDPNRLCLYDTVLRHKRHVSLAKEKPWWRPSCTHHAFINDVTSPTSGAGDRGVSSGTPVPRKQKLSFRRGCRRREAARVCFSSKTIMSLKGMTAKFSGRELVQDRF